jgi:hypothetical protein
MLPILTHPDRLLLQPWFDALASHTVAAVGRELPTLQRLAARFSNRWHTAEHILTILILWTINMWVLRRLLAGPLGRPPTHGDSGRYFIWGEELAQGPTHITGIRALRASTGYALCLLVSRLVDRPGLKASRRLYGQVAGVSGVDRLAELTVPQDGILSHAPTDASEPMKVQRWLEEQRDLRVLTADAPPQLRIPVFGPQEVLQMAQSCGHVAQQTTNWLCEDSLLEPLLESCSFAHCPRPTVLCMLWHNSYYEATDRLIAQSILPPFPTVAEGEWGVWLTSNPYGLRPALV